MVRAGSRGLGGFSTLVPLRALRQFLHPCAHMTLPRFQRDVLIYGSCMNCTPRVTRKNLQGAADLNPY